MAMADAATIAQKWSDRMNASSTAYSAGIMRVQTSPMAAAANNVAGYVAGVQAAANSGKWAAGLNRVTLQQWQSQATALGAMRLGPGATQAKPKFQAFMTSFLPFLATAQAQVKAMPNQTYDQRKARAVAMMDALHQFKRT